MLALSEILFVFGILCLCGESSGIGLFFIAISGFGMYLIRRKIKELFYGAEKNVSNNDHKSSSATISRITNKLLDREIYEFAEQVEKLNTNDSIALYQIAAEKKSIPAYIKLGKLYYDGENIAKDHQKAFDYWNLCPQKLDSDSSLKLADMYRDGDGTKKDLKKAFQFYQNASKDDFSQRIIEIYEQGTDLPEYLKAVASIYEERFDAGEKQILDKIIEIYTKLNDNENLQKWQIVKAKNGDTDLALCLGKKFFHENNRKTVSK